MLPAHRIESCMSFILKIAIHATPGAKRTEAAGLYGDALRVRLGAPPVDGKANEALIAWAADTFGVVRKQVELLHGAAGRQKVLAVAFSDAAALNKGQALLARLRGETTC